MPLIGFWLPDWCNMLWSNTKWQKTAVFGTVVLREFLGPWSGLLSGWLVVAIPGRSRDKWQVDRAGWSSKKGKEEGYTRIKKPMLGQEYVCKTTKMWIVQRRIQARLKRMIVQAWSVAHAWNLSTWKWRQEECEFEGSLHIGDAVSKAKQGKVKTREARERTVVNEFSV